MIFNKNLLQSVLLNFSTVDKVGVNSQKGGVKTRGTENKRMTEKRNTTTTICSLWRITYDEFIQNHVSRLFASHPRACYNTQLADELDVKFRKRGMNRTAEK